MPQNPEREDADDESVSLLQRIHAATGDRDAEAEALADDADDDVSTGDAKRAVQLARGERGAEAPMPDNDIATPGDARAVSDEDPEDPEPLPVDERGEGDEGPGSTGRGA